MTPKVALITLADHRDEFYALRAELAEAERRKLRACLAEEVELLQDDLVRGAAEARAAGETARRGGAEALLLHTPIWAPPNLGLVAAQRAGLPLGVIANTSLATSGLPGLLSCGAALDQAGLAHRRFYGDPEDPGFRGELRSFSRAAAARARLRLSRLGLFGGMSIGLYSTGFDPAQWLRLFGVEAVHHDQGVLVGRAEAQSGEAVAGLRRWLTAGLGALEYGPSLTEGHLDRQLRSYLALRDLAREEGLDVLALKCQPELSNGYVLQCLNVALQNDPYDHDGPKKPIPCACEADGDGALTMLILQLLSGNPTALLDVRGFIPAEGLLVLANCGAMATYFAGRSPDPGANLAEVRVQPHVFGRAGGGATQFVAAPGPLTLARLCRRGGRYWLAVLAGEAVRRSREELKQTTPCWPHAFVRVELDPAAFVREFGANHLQATPGDWRPELAEFCRLLDLEYRDFTGGERSSWP